MPLFPKAVSLIRANLEAIRDGLKVKPVSIGMLTDDQTDAINRHRLAQNAALPLIVAEVIFIGSNIYLSRVARDGYSIDDVIDQIASAMDSASGLVGNLPMQTIENPAHRTDRYGNQVHDRAVFECMSRHPRPELFSVVPKGDKIRPLKKKGRS
jgi:hydroxymethylpyrimidine/phosphomethylpyrimidine kinase